MEDTDNRGNRGKKLKRKFIGTRKQNQRHHAHPYTENKTDAIRKVHKVNMSLQRPLIQDKMSRYTSKCTAFANFNACID